MHALGIDIGGSGIKGAVIDLDSGNFVSDRIRIETPRPADVGAVTQVILDIASQLKWKGPVGIGFPGVIQQNVVRTAANLDASWVNADVTAQLCQALGGPVVFVNDADAAGLAEVEFGAGRNCRGLTLLVTVGTGLGTALLVDGKLVPNMELGHLIVPHLSGDGSFGEGEAWASGRVREIENLSFEEWGARFSDYLAEICRLLWPDQILVGGGIAKEFDHWRAYVKAPAPILPAALRNRAGIVGAALAVKGCHCS